MSSGSRPVDAYVNKFCRALKATGGIQVKKTTDTGDGERRVILEPNTYPCPVTKVKVIVSYAAAVGPSVTYCENWSGDVWKCRWGRHANPHNTEEHFHYPPDAGENENPPAVDASYGQDILMMENVAEFLSERYTDIISSDSHTYPVDYDWTNEYSSDTYQYPP